jgi:hypothetical protein|tara:strand:- start:1564 stop:1743 length:180 start_codon:yes stop_codon:yes gene_type:complete
MLTPREKYIVDFCEEIHNNVADACEGLLDVNNEEARVGVRKLLISVERLSNLIHENNEY